MLQLPILQPRRLASVPTPSPVAGAVERTAPRSVRLSLTDRCDLACIYCRPGRDEAYVERRLDVDAWDAMVAGLVESGVRRVRFTGGEPLLHRDVVEVVRRVAANKAIEDIALTTNGTRLAKLARPLHDAGLRRITVSLDSLREDTFARMTRGGNLAGVLAGIDAACAARFDEIKLNAVVVKDENDDELEALTRFAWERGITPRFLEVMLIGEGAKMEGRVVSGAAMRRALSHLLEADEPRRDPDRGPAKYVAARHDPRLRVGFITGTSDTYCAGCDRLRVSAEGTLRPCLATNDGVSAEASARAGDAGGIAHAVAEAWRMKPDGATFKGCTEESASGVSIRAIGG